MRVKTKTFVMTVVSLCFMGMVGCQSTDTQEAAALNASMSESISEIGEIPEIADTQESLRTAAEAISESFTVTYEETQMEVLLSDCLLEYDSEELKIYVKDIEYSKEFPFCGTVIYMQGADDSLLIMGAQDYCINRKNGEIYISFRDMKNDSFVGMYRYFLRKTSDGSSISGDEVISTYLVEDWLLSTYELAKDDSQETFSDLWLILTSMEYDEQGNVILKGEASGIDKTDGEKYHIDWEINDTVREEKVSFHETKIYEKEKDREVFEACEKAFDLIEQCDKSVLILPTGQMESFTKAEEQRRKETYGRKWHRIDVNGDGLPELVASEGGENSPVQWIFAYVGGMTKTVEAVYSDLGDYTEYLFVNNNGNLVYDNSSFGTMDYGGYTQCCFDEKWREKPITKLEIYYFYEADYYEDEGTLKEFKESFPDTFGKNGGGYYFFKTDYEVESESVTKEKEVREEISKEEFVEAYREMTGLSFFEANIDFMHES